MARYALSQTPSTKEAKDKKAAQKTGKDADKKTDKSADTQETTASLSEHFRIATAELHRAAQKGALHRKAVARKVSRLAKRMKAMTQGDGKKKDGRK